MVMITFMIMRVNGLGSLQINIMKEIKQDCYKGTRILLGNEKSNYIQKCRKYLINHGFVEIQIPIIQLSETFKDKVGEENNNMMYNFKDRGSRDICLAPEYTSVIQKLSKTYFKNKTNVMVFYVSECFRGEKPQKGRYRQFTQLGVEIINPTSNELKGRMTHYAIELCNLFSEDQRYLLNTNVSRGLDYYKEGRGFEITLETLGSSKQICGGGEYEGGIGFAIGVDRLMLLNN